MKIKYLSIALILIIATLLASCRSEDNPVLSIPQDAQPGDLTDLNECKFQPDGSKMEYVAECGLLVVPENRDVYDSQLIGLPVVRIPARSSNPKQPVFWLEGGPGESNLSWEPPDWLLEDHDVVMVGYRGVDGTVKLSCPELGRLLKAHLGKDLFSETARAEYVAAVEACANDHQEKGVDLTGYTIPQVIEDLEAARVALGYDRINLFSQSYGTRLAQIYAYMHPGSLYRLVLIAVNTPGYFIGDPVVLDELIEHLSELCTKDATCSSRTSDFAQTIYDVNHNMPERWLFFNIDPDTVRLGAHFMFLNTNNMPMVFDAYLTAGEGDPSGMAMANLMTRIMTPIDQFVYGDNFSKGGSSELDKYGGIESIELGDSIMGVPMAEWVWPMGEVWPIDMIPKDLREFQESDVEMLLVNGTLDFATPPNTLEEAKPYFHKAQMVLLPEFSHVYDVYELQPEAFERLITSYYDTGVADDSLFVYQPLNFEPGWSLASMARMLVITIIVLPMLIILVVLLLVSRIRKYRKNNR